MAKKAKRIRTAEYKEDYWSAHSGEINMSKKEYDVYIEDALDASYRGKANMERAMRDALKRVGMGADEAALEKAIQEGKKTEREKGAFGMDLRHLNNKKYGDKQLFSRKDITEYYDVGNSNMILAHFSKVNQWGSPEDWWEYVDRGILA